VSLPRRLVAVEWAHKCEVPDFARTKRASGTRALGLAYERKLAKVLPAGALHGQWFIYRADGRVGYCQPDFLLKGKSEVAVLEAKLADVELAWDQLKCLYTPVLRHFYEREPLCVVVTRSVARVPANAEVCETLKDALRVARAGLMPVLHWIGTGRI